MILCPCKLQTEHVSLPDTTRGFIHSPAVRPGHLFIPFQCHARGYVNIA
jgi:hypothetical protein